MSPDRGECRACAAPILWARMPSGRLNPLNVAEVAPDTGKGVTAYNPANGHGMPVTIGCIEECAGWAQAGITFHTSHFSDCPARERFKVSPSKAAV